MNAGEEVVEEGAGFGVPIVMFGEEAYFCRKAQTQLRHVSQDSVVLKKTFFLDSVSRKRVLGFQFKNGLYMLFHRVFQKGYLTQRKTRRVFDWMMHLRGVLGVETEFVEAPPKGEVAVTYRLNHHRISVHTDFSKVDRTDCTEILVLNEQGATSFPCYRDSSGTQLVERGVEAWAKVLADEASFIDPDSGLAFSLRNLGSAQLLRGREQVKNRFSWAGLTYLLSPKVAEFDYSIWLSRGFVGSGF
jgi:hypothetical protein